jgi:hypothetical protein
VSALICTRCEWQSTEIPPLDMSEATWHVYEEHRELWNEVFGDRPPHDPDVRTPGGRAEYLARMTGMGKN